MADEEDALSAPGAVPRRSQGVPFSASVGSVPGERSMPGQLGSTRRAGVLLGGCWGKEKRKKAMTEETGLSSLCRGLGLSHTGFSEP